MPFAATHGGRDCHTEWSESDREEKIYDTTSAWNLIFFKSDIHELIYKTETVTDFKNELMFTKEEICVLGGQIRSLGWTYKHHYI